MEESQDSGNKIVAYEEHFETCRNYRRLDAIFGHLLQTLDDEL